MWILASVVSDILRALSPAITDNDPSTHHNAALRKRVKLSLKPEVVVIQRGGVDQVPLVEETSLYLMVLPFSFESSVC